MVRKRWTHNTDWCWECSFLLFGINH